MSGHGRFGPVVVVWFGDPTPCRTGTGPSGWGKGEETRASPVGFEVRGSRSGFRLSVHTCIRERTDIPSPHTSQRIHDLIFHTRTHTRVYTRGRTYTPHTLHSDRLPPTHVRVLGSIHTTCHVCTHKCLLCCTGETTGSRTIGVESLV